MTSVEAVVVALAGFAAGVLGAVVGNGTLVVFPTLVLFGIPPVMADVSNGLGLVAGSVSAAVGLRAEYEKQRQFIFRASIVTGIGAVGGATLLLVLPAATFSAATPVLIGGSLVLVLLQPQLTRRLERRRLRRPTTSGLSVLLVVFGIAVYGGYFGGGQGLAYLAALTIFVPEGLRRIQAVKVLLVGIANTVSSVAFILAGAPIAWWAVLLLAVGSTAGGLVGVRAGDTIARRFSPNAMRWIIVAVGGAALAKALLG